jgi:membrane protein
MWRLIKETFDHWFDDRASSMGAALAFYSAFSIAPLLIIVISIAGMVFEPAAAQGAIVGQLSGLVGEEGASVIQAMLVAAGQRETGKVAAFVGFFTLLVGATSAFVELQDSLDRIWKAPKRAGSGLVNFLRSRVLSFGMVLAIGFLLLVSLVLTAALAALTEYYSYSLPINTTLLQVGNFFVSLVIVTVLFAMIYKWLPNVTIAWRDVWIGATVTALLFGVGRTAIGLYLGHSAIASAYGAAGAFVVLLLWLYYSAQVFLFGAEFTWVYANRVGSHAEKGSRSGSTTSEPRENVAGANLSSGNPWSGLARRAASLAALTTFAFAVGRLAAPLLVRVGQSLQRQFVLRSRARALANRWRRG